MEGKSSHKLIFLPCTEEPTLGDNAFYSVSMWPAMPGWSPNEEELIMFHFSPYFYRHHANISCHKLKDLEMLRSFNFPYATLMDVHQYPENGKMWLVKK